MSSHACETTEEYVVPDNCVYITLGECGKVTTMSNSLSDPFLKLYRLFQESNPILRDPNKNREELKHIFGQFLEIKTAGEKYKNVKYERLVGIETYRDKIINKDLLYTQHAGLHKIGSQLIVNDELLKMLRAQHSMTHTPDSVHIRIKGQTIQLSEIEIIFKESIKPTLSEVINILPKGQTIFTKAEVENLINANFKYTQSGLFATNPGIYYNFSCRVPCARPASSQLKLFEPDFSVLANL